ncbi:hypothetical protein ACFTWS_33370 [Streptomyces sp. NPDC057027]|uniref:hypothetical protein n=1 Tax=Streptomyces sp. NPDC057027 TaxID=3346004 RepID=UPI00363D711F
MLGDSDYASKWEEKKTWYAEQGIVEGDGGPHGLLLVADDRGGVKEHEWEAVFLKAFGTSVSIRPRSTARQHKPR